MVKITWDEPENRQWETGVDHGILFPITNGNYGDGVAWNGLTAVTESPSGAEPTPFYADNMKYAILYSTEEFAATIEAVFYPKEFEACDGSAEIAPGVSIGQQDRQPFGFYYRTIIGDANTPRKGYKHHFIYGCTAAPTEKAANTVNDSPENSAFSWELSTQPVAVGTIGSVEYKPTASLVVNSLRVASTPLNALLDIVQGTAGSAPRMPLPSEVAAVIGSGTVVNMALDASKPTFVSGTGVITLPNVTGVQWKVNGVNKAAGAQPAIATGTSAEVKAVPLATYTLQGDTDFTFARP